MVQVCSGQILILRSGAKVTVVTDSRTDGCDVVVIDVFLRSGSGLRVLERMKEYQASPERIVLTNYATPETRSRCHLSVMGCLLRF